MCFLSDEGLTIDLKNFRKPGEKTFTQRSRLFVGNLPPDITEEEMRKLFEKYGKAGEVFIHKDKGFGFIRLVSDCRFVERRRGSRGTVGMGHQAANTSQTVCFFKACACSWWNGTKYADFIMSFLPGFCFEGIIGLFV